MNNGGYSSNCKIVPAEILHLMAKYTLPFSKPVKSDHNQNLWYFQNNHIKTTKIFSVRSSPDPPILKKKCSPIQSCPAKIGFSPDPVRSSPVRQKLASVLIQSDPFLIRAHLWDWSQIWPDQDWIGLQFFWKLVEQDWIGLTNFFLYLCDYSEHIKNFSCDLILQIC